jgi:pyruvate/2-oxoglutarate dehydrogenase complex dihydrolipoamide dehydrogenase (E3) component
MPTSAFVALDTANWPNVRRPPIGHHPGFMKALLPAHVDLILGFTMIGPEVGEVMAAVQMTILAGLPYTRLRDAILTHPTMSEGLGALFSDVRNLTTDRPRHD